MLQRVKCNEVSCNSGKSYMSNRQYKLYLIINKQTCLISVQDEKNKFSDKDQKLIKMRREEIVRDCNLNTIFTFCSKNQQLPGCIMRKQYKFNEKITETEMVLVLPHLKQAGYRKSPSL